jgi:hypothetical protein
MRLFEYAIRVFRDVNGREEAVLGARCCGEGVGDGVDLGRFRDTILWRLARVVWRWRVIGWLSR